MVKFLRPTYCDNLSSTLSVHHIFSWTCILFHLKSRILKSIPIPLPKQLVPTTLYVSFPTTRISIKSLFLYHAPPSLSLSPGFLTIAPVNKGSAKLVGGRNTGLCTPLFKITTKILRTLFFFLKIIRFFYPSKFQSYTFLELSMSIWFGFPLLLVCSTFGG